MDLLPLDEIATPTSTAASARAVACRAGGWPACAAPSRTATTAPADQLRGRGRRRRLSARHDHVYRPGVDAVRRELLPGMYAYKTDTDLFLWVYQRRRALRVTDVAKDFDDAARDASLTAPSSRPIA
jgi:hypothetical protein